MKGEVRGLAAKARGMGEGIKITNTGNRQLQGMR